MADAKGWLFSIVDIEVDTEVSSHMACRVNKGTVAVVFCKCLL